MIIVAEWVFAAFFVLAVGRALQMFVRRVRERLSWENPDELDEAIMDDQVWDWGISLLIKITLVAVFAIAIFLYPPELANRERSGEEVAATILLFCVMGELIWRQEVAAYFYRKRSRLYAEKKDDLTNGGVR